MNYIRITKENIDKEHICCAMSGKQSVAKKEWLRQRFDDGLVFYRSEERGKCFIEYIPAENAWVPIAADGYLYINCLWVSGSMKGHGFCQVVFLLLIKAILRSHFIDSFMIDRDIQIGSRYSRFRLHDIPVSVIGFGYNAFRNAFCSVTDFVHFPKQIFEQLFLVIVHCGNLLRIIRIGVCLNSIHGKNLFPNGTTATHFKHIIGIAVSYLHQLVIILRIDFLNGSLHSLSRS